MSKKAAEHHKKASMHSGEAAKHHDQAAKQHEAGQYEKAAHPRSHCHWSRAPISNVCPLRPQRRMPTSTARKRINKNGVGERPTPTLGERNKPQKRSAAVVIRLDAYPARYFDAAMLTHHGLKLASTLH